MTLYKIFYTPHSVLFCPFEFFYNNIKGDFTTVGFLLQNYTLPSAYMKINKLQISIFVA